MQRGLILQPSYRIRDGIPVVQLFGRLEAGPAFLVECDHFRPYFFVPAEDARRFEALPDAGVSECDLQGLDGTTLVRITAGLPGDVPKLRDRATRSFESDIRFPYRYLIDCGVRAAIEIEGDAEPHSRNTNLLRFHNPKLHPADCRPDLSVLSIDLETSPDASTIFSVALVGAGISEVHLLAERDVAGAIVYGDERSLLDAAASRIREVDPDIITGWNVVDFDLRTWDARARALGAPLALGRVRGNVHFQEDMRFTRQARASVPGRMVLDGIPLVRDAMRLTDYRLETVARAVLGRGKLIDGEVPDAAAEIARQWKQDPEALVAYNREDAQLVLDILEHEGLLALSVERSLLSGMQLDRVGASVASFDLLYLPELRARGLVAPSVDAARKATGLRGGAVLDSKPGLFSQVAVFDFKSLYPSLIRTFNLDPLAHARGDSSGIEAPGGARFARDEAILPEIIERYMARREAARARGDRNADQAIKIMMNALYGVLGAAGCRFFDPEVANAITGFGQQTLLWTREAFEESGSEVIYGDTDSVFVQLHSRRNEAAREEAAALRASIESRIEARVRSEYDVTPRLVLELEKVFERFFMPRVRGGKTGSKKRYAGLIDGSLEVVGLESVRRDWPAIAGSLQRGLLERVFADQDPLPFTREIIEAVRGGQLDADLIYSKRIRKGSVDSYTASVPPHVQAARKARTASTGGVIHYVIAKSGPEPAIPGRPLPGDLDYTHYLEKVLRPVAEAILVHVGKDFDEAAGNPRQLSLL
jgi:DNA polymerase-2